MDLSNNSVDRGFISIAASLISQQHGVRILNFENCNLSAKSTTALFEALAKNYAMSLSIRELYVGGNKFDELSMNAMCHWLDQSKGTILTRYRFTRAKNSFFRFWPSNYFGASNFRIMGEEFCFQHQIY